MAEVQLMKLTEVVSKNLITEKDNLRHIDKTKEPSKYAIEQQQPTIGSPADPKEAETPSGDDHSPPKQLTNAEGQPSNTSSLEQPSNNEQEPQEEPDNATTDEQEDASDHNYSKEFIIGSKISHKI